MIKKIIFILFLLTSITMCGKKSDPEYKGQKPESFNTKIFVVL
tara:strand:+ start:450 stop:578 length:129 start_codon:yes stop_codon:yes gene_type:complete